MFVFGGFVLVCVLWLVLFGFVCGVLRVCLILVVCFGWFAASLFAGWLAVWLSVCLLIA